MKCLVSVGGFELLGGKGSRSYAVGKCREAVG